MSELTSEQILSHALRQMIAGQLRSSSPTANPTDADINHVYNQSLEQSKRELELGR